MRSSLIEDSSFKRSLSEITMREGGGESSRLFNLIRGSPRISGRSYTFVSPHSSRSLIYLGLGSLELRIANQFDWIRRDQSRENRAIGEGFFF